MTDYQLSPDDMASLLVGRIVRGWSTIDDYIHGEIGSLQMKIRARHWRIPRTRYPETPVDFIPSRRIDISDPKRQWKLKLRYFKLLCRALMANDVLFLNDLDCLTQRLPPLYLLRNEVAHGLVLPRAPWEGDGIEIRSHEWVGAAFRERMKPTSQRRQIEIKRAYSVAELDACTDELTKVWWDLRELVGRIPVIGPPIEPPEPPS